MTGGLAANSSRSVPDGPGASSDGKLSRCIVAAAPLREAGAMPDAPARIAVVTGATSGIGRVTAERLAKQGWTVLCTGRNAQRGHDAVGVIRHASGNRHVDFLQADLSSIAATKALGAIILGRHPRIDLLINNAGALFDRRRQT